MNGGFILLYLLILNILAFNPLLSQNAFAERISTDKDVIKFKWALVARLESKGQNEPVNILCGTYCNCEKEGSTAKSSGKFSVSDGDKLAIYVEPIENAYVYIYFLDSKGKLELIFPTKMDDDTLKREFEPTYIPDKNKWFTFDDRKGTETFYLIARSKPLRELEERTVGYIKLDQQIVLDEINKTKLEIAFGRTLKELTVASLPPTRGAGIDIASLACEIEARHFYSKTVEFKHE